MSEDLMQLCYTCEKMLWHTNLEHFEHIKNCKGRSPDSPISTRWFKWPKKSPKACDEIDIGITFQPQKRPSTR